MRDGGSGETRVRDGGVEDEIKGWRSGERE